MANISSNPWSFDNTDPTIATITGATGLTLNADGTVTLTTTAPFTFNNSATVPPQWFTVIGATAAAYNGFYKLVSGASGASSFVLVPQFSIPAGTAQSGGGTVAQCQYNAYTRIEDMSWQNASAAGQLLDVRDRSGNILWKATATGAGAQNRGKVFWVNGLTIITLQSGVLIATVN